MGAIVVHHQAQRKSSGKLLVQPVEKLQEFLVPMPRVARPDHPSLQQFQGGEHRRGAVAFILMRYGPAPALLHRQTRLRAIQGLNWGLLVDAQHQSLLRRIQRQAHHLRQLLQKLDVP